MLTQQQKLIRKSGIGGSDAAAICGKSKWKTPRDVYVSKTSEEVEKDINSEAMRNGSYSEGFVLNLYQKITGLEVLTSDVTLAHLKHEFILGNLDGFIPKTNRILEIKTARYRDKEVWGDEGGDVIPIDYLFQVAHYCMIKEAAGADIAVFFAGSQFKIYKYERSEALEKLLLKKEVEFWNEYVEKKVCPPLINLKDAQNEFSDVIDSEVVADDIIESKVLDYKTIKEKQKALSDEEDTIKTDILMHMRESPKLVDKFGNVLLTYKSQSRESISGKDLKLDYPAVYNEYVKKSNFRVMRVKK